MAFIAKDGHEKMTSLNVWWLNLKNLYKEIHAKLGETEVKKVDGLFKKVSNIAIVTTRKTRDAGNVKEIDKRMYFKKWNDLWGIEVLLRYFATKRGLLLKDRDNAMEMI